MRVASGQMRLATGPGEPCVGLGSLGKHGWAWGCRGTMCGGLGGTATPGKGVAGCGLQACQGCLLAP